MTELPSELRTLVKRYGTQVLDDADGLRATLDDFLDETSAQPGDVNLVVDAVRFGSLNRLRSLLEQGVEPGVATADVAEALAQRRGGDAESAYWACAVLGYAADLLPGDLIPGTWVRPSTQFPSSTTTGSRSAPHGDAGPEVASSGQVEGLLDENTTYRPSRGGEDAGPLSLGGGPGTNRGAGGSAPADSPPRTNGSRPSRSWILAALIAVIAILAAGIIYLLVTRDASDGEQAMHGAHDVPAADVLAENVFGHFGGNLANVLGPVCSDAAAPNVDFLDYNCSFLSKYGDFYINFNNGDPLTVNANGKLPDIVQFPPAGTIVTKQQQPDVQSYHAYYMKFLGDGKDGLKNTDDDLVSLTLYDVDPKHPGEANFISSKENTNPLTKAQANGLLSAIGADRDKFPLPQPFVQYLALRNFAHTFLDSEQYAHCVEAFRVFNEEYEHVSCRTPLLEVGFGYTKSLNIAKYRYRGGTPYSWTDRNGSGQLSIATYGGFRHLFWYPDNEDSGGAVWGLITVPSQHVSDSGLLRYFMRFRDNPKALPE